jgi:hypothetical protein
LSVVGLASCDDAGGPATTGDGAVFDVVVEVAYSYVQPSVEDCATPESRREATLRFTMPGSLYQTDGCGDATDGKLHVLCGSDAMVVEVIRTANGATWDTDQIARASNFLSVFRFDGRTWLDLHFQADSSEYQDPGCSGEMTYTDLYASAILFAEEGNEFITFDEIDLSLGVPFQWTGHYESGDQCDVGCFTTVDVTVDFVVAGQ